MRASLPMYDLPELRAETDAWWSALARAFRKEGCSEVPGQLARGGDLTEHWLAGDLLFSQTCGYPLTHSLKGRVRLLATPSYAVPGCAGGLYHSEILVRTDSAFAGLGDLRGARAVANDAASQSGYAALRAAIAPLAEGGRFFAAVHFSGSHRESMARVREGKADVCAIDCVTYHLLAKALPESVGGLRCLAQSPTAPALPYITSLDTAEAQCERLLAGLKSAFADPALQGLRAALLLDDVLVRPLSAYDRILEIEADAVARGYPELA